MSAELAQTENGLIGKIHWSADAPCVDDSEPVTGEVVEDGEGMITVMESPTHFRRVFKGSNGDLLLRAMKSKSDRDRDTRIMGRVDDIEVEL